MQRGTLRRIPLLMEVESPILFVLLNHSKHAALLFQMHLFLGRISMDI